MGNTNMMNGQPNMQNSGSPVTGQNMGPSGSPNGSPNSTQYNGQYNGQYGQNNMMQQQGQNGYVGGGYYQAQNPQEQQMSTRPHDPLLVKPYQPYEPETQNVNGQQFLRIAQELPPIECMLYNSGGSGWSFGKDQSSGAQGWFPTTCVQFDIVKAQYKFDAKPEESREYIQFQAETQILVEQRYDCGWWLGSILGENGSVGAKGYFPGNYTIAVDAN
jgi:hypothetical protein